MFTIYNAAVFKSSPGCSFLVLCLIAVMSTGCKVTGEFGQNQNRSALLFEDSGTKDWRDKWFLDGERARVINSNAGMELVAGPEQRNDTCHTVLWTKTSFNGDIRIEYDYTRTDSSTQYVNILYFMATGKGDAEYPADISLWNEKRVVPHMRTYFNNMKTYHISYAAYGLEPGSPADDYIRLRRYDPNKSGLKGTDIEGDHFTTGLFKPNVTYHIKVIRSGGRIEMHVQNVENEEDDLVCKWDVSGSPAYDSGRVGFRHMYTRSARYKNVKIWSLK